MEGLKGKLPAGATVPLSERLEGDDNTTAGWIPFPFPQHRMLPFVFLPQVHCLNLLLPLLTPTSLLRSALGIAEHP